MSLNTKVIYETLVNLLILNKFSLCYMGLRPIFRKKTSKVRTHRDPFCKILVWFIHSLLWGHHRIADIRAPRGHIWNMVIPAIWDVIWGLVDLFPSFDRPPNTLTPKYRHSKKIIFTNFQLLTEAAIIACKVLSKERHSQVKIGKAFFANSISANSHRILMTTIWKSIYFNRSKRL